MRSILKRKRAAIELSMTTVVVIVLAMTMLAVGLTLVRTLFKGAIYTAGSLNTQIQDQINQMFQSETTTVGIVSDQGLLEPSRGDDSCVWWAIVAYDSGTYDYTFSIIPAECADASKGYRLTDASIGKWFLTPLHGSVSLAPNQPEKYCLRFNIPSNAPSCLFSVDLVVTKDGVNYGSERVDIRPKKSTLFG